MKKFITKDSWKRKIYDSWFNRDESSEKLRFDLIPIDMLERLAWLYTRWAVKYWDNNRQKARWEELESFKRSARRHFINFMKWIDDWEDHLIATCRNLFSYWHLKSKEDNGDT